MGVDHVRILGISCDYHDAAAALAVAREVDDNDAVARKIPTTICSITCSLHCRGTRW